MEIGQCTVPPEMAEPGKQWFRVTLRQWHHMRDEGPFFNPFRARDIWRKRPCTHRVWEFRANDADEVRRLYQEAKDAKRPNVYGFDLLSIEKVPPPTDIGER